MVKVLDREKIKRMTGAGSGVVGSSGGGDVDLSGYATQIWTTENFVSIEFFRELFRAYDSNSQEILPNDTTSVVASIKAMVGTWTEEYLTALGNAGGGGGGGGGAQYLNDLLDVHLTTPLTDGQALVYNATLQKWVNGAAGVNMTTVWNALAGSTNEQINASHLSTALSGYVTTSAISDMATQTWVGQQGFATQTWVTSNFISIAYFDRLFRAYNNSTLVSHNDTTSTIDNIKAMFGFWTEFYLSALGTGGVSSVSISLSQLADVNVAGVTNNQLLGYDSTNSEWVNTSLKTINGNSIIGTGDLTIAGVSTLSGLTDVLLSSLSANQMLIWDSSSSKWVNSSLKTVNGYPLYGDGNIVISGGGSTINEYCPHFRTGMYNLTYPSLGYLDNKTLGIYGTENNTFTTYGMFFWVDTYNGYNYIQGGRTDGYTNAYPIILNPLGGKVGIGITNPVYTLEVNGAARCDLVRFNDSNKNNIGYIGYGGIANNIEFSAYSGYSISFGSNNIDHRMIITSSGYVSIGTWYPESPLTVINQSANVYIAQFKSYQSSVYIANYYGHGISISTTAGGNSSIYLISSSAGGAEVFCARANGSVGINTATPAYDLHVNGNAYATGAVTALSDQRHKTIIKDAAVSVEDIARMPAVMYQWNDGREDKELHVGSIAQNWQTVLPEVVLKANDEEGTLSMQYGVAALVSSIIIARKVVNHDERIKQLEKEIEILKNENRKLTA